MLLKHLQEQQKKQQQTQSDFYTAGGLHVYFKDPILNDKVDIERVISHVESKIPKHLLSETEMIIIGWFEEFDKRSVNAFYIDGTLYISNVQDDNEDLYDDIVHEIAHSLEGPHGYTIYGDREIHDEFLRKRKHLYDILWKAGHKTPQSFFMDPEFSDEFDMFLFKDVGYDKLNSYAQGLFISAYAATSLQEYFATGFTEFYLHSDHKFLKTVSPELYKKLYLIQDPKKLDNAY